MSTAANLYPAPGAAPTAVGQLPVSVHSSQANADVQRSTGEATVSGTPALPTVVGQGVTTQATAVKAGKLAAFEGFLKKAGHIAGVVLTDIIKYVIPVASVVAIADPAAAPAVEAFTASVRLVQASVINVQQKWVAEGSNANAQKLADVLEIVEQPVVTMFAQAGMRVDTAYVTNLINGVVAILNAQPGAVLPKAA